MSSGREVHGKENLRKLYAVGLRTEPALLVRGSSRRITIMRFRPTNIRVINRRNSRLDRHLRYLLRKGRKKTEKKQKKVLDEVIPYQCFTMCLAFSTSSPAFLTAFSVPSAVALAAFLVPATVASAAFFVPEAVASAAFAVS